MVGFDAVLQRQNESAWSDHRPHSIGRFANLPGLHAENDRVDNLYLRWISSCANGRDREVTVNAVNAKASRAQRAQVLSTGDERDAITRQRQPSDKISSD